MSRLLYRLRYQFYRVQAYLADLMDDRDTADELLSIANESHRLWVRETIQ